MQTILVETAGGVPVWQDIELGKSWNKVGLEQIAAWDADQIYLVAYNRNSSEIVAALKSDPQWRALRAVKNGELYAFPADFYSWDQPDVRWILGLTWLATKVQPELFAEVDVLQEARAFFQEMYGLDQAAFEKWIQPRLKGDLP
jgi:iron complex transport system substrate-binding protein